MQAVIQVIPLNPKPRYIFDNRAWNKNASVTDVPNMLEEARRRALHLCDFSCIGFRVRVKGLGVRVCSLESQLLKGGSRGDYLGVP